MSDLAQARRVMVDNQIRTFDVTDRAVLAAFDSVPREAFLPASLRAIAYTDRRLDLPLSGGASRALLPPLILARLIQALQPKPGEEALDILGGAGYSAAILAAMGLKTTFLEADSELAASARANFERLSVAAMAAPANPAMSADKGPGLAGMFDVILINGASEVSPSGFFGALKEGGRLGLLERQGPAARAVLYLKSAGGISPRLLFDAQAPILPGFAREKAFVFA